MSYVPATYLSCAETAKLLRAALKKNFPGIKFSVRSHTYAGGASIDVDWVDGPRDTVVNEVAQEFSGASFDGMIDLKSYHSSTLETGEIVHHGADFVFTHREHSPALVAKATEIVKANLDKPFGEPYSDDILAGSSFVSGRLPSGRWIEYNFATIVRATASEISA